MPTNSNLDTASGGSSKSHRLMSELERIQLWISEGRGAVIDGPDGDSILIRPVEMDVGGWAWSIEYDGAVRSADALITAITSKAPSPSKAPIQVLHVVSVRYYNGKPAYIGEVVIEEPDILGIRPASDATGAPTALPPEIGSIVEKAGALSLDIARCIPSSEGARKRALIALQEAIGKALPALRGGEPDDL